MDGEYRLAEIIRIGLGDKQMDKCEKEKILLAKWAKENINGYQFPQIDTVEETYFVSEGDRNYIREYNMNILPDIREELESMWHGDELMQEIIRTVGVSAMKNKPKDMTFGRQNAFEYADDTKEQLMPFIYNF